MALSTVRNKLKEVLLSVSGIDLVYLYERSTGGDWGKYLSLFQQANGTIAGWMITRRQTPARPGGQTWLERTHFFDIYGIAGLQDDEATELNFQDLVETIVQTFWTARASLPSDVTYILGPVQVNSITNKTFGRILCHTAHLSIAVTDLDDGS
jgi:hypothetical protein